MEQVISGKLAIALYVAAELQQDGIIASAAGSIFGGARRIGIEMS